MASGKIKNKPPYILEKRTLSGTSFTINFSVYGAEVFAFMWGRFGYDSTVMSMAIVSHSNLNTVAVKCFGDQTVTATCDGNVVTITTPQPQANVSVMSNYEIT